MEKTPHNVRWVPHLRIAFPKARFIHIVRHPVDVLSSYRKRFAVNPKDKWANLSPEEFCVRWNVTTRAALALTKREPHFLLVRYEELTERSEETLRIMLDHIGEPFDAACLMPDAEQPPEWIPATWLEAYPQSYGPMVTATKKWEEFLDPVTAGRVEERLADTLASLGYERRVSATGPTAPPAR